MTARRGFFTVDCATVLRDGQPDDLVLCRLRLEALLVDRWARDRLGLEEAETVTLSEGDARNVTGKAQHPAQVRVLESTGKWCGFQVTSNTTPRARHITVHWPKWSELQGLDARVRAVSRPQAPAPAPAPASPPHTPPPGGARRDVSQTRNPRRSLRERCKAAGVPGEALDRGVAALEHAPALSDAELRYVSRTSCSIEKAIEAAKQLPEVQP